MAAGPWKGPRQLSTGWDSRRRKRPQRPWPEGEGLKTPTPSPVIVDLLSTDQKSASARGFGCLEGPLWVRRNDKQREREVDGPDGRTHLWKRWELRL